MAICVSNLECGRAINKLPTSQWSLLASEESFDFWLKVAFDFWLKTKTLKTLKSLFFSWSNLLWFFLCFLIIIWVARMNYKRLDRDKLFIVFDFFSFDLNFDVWIRWWVNTHLLKQSSSTTQTHKNESFTTQQTHCPGHTHSMQLLHLPILRLYSSSSYS